VHAFTHLSAVIHRRSKEPELAIHCVNRLDKVHHRQSSVSIWSKDSNKVNELVLIQTTVGENAKCGKDIEMKARRHVFRPKE
jgi:hypothetical protein